MSGQNVGTAASAVRRAQLDKSYVEERRFSAELSRHKRWALAPDDPNPTSSPAYRITPCTSSDPGMARLRRLFDHPTVLADGPPPRPSLARPRGSPFRVLVPAWIVMWVGMGALTGPWRRAAFYSTPWSWIPASAPFRHRQSFIYSSSGAHFSWAQLGGLPEVRDRQPRPAPRDHRNPLASPPPRLSRPPLRNAGLERRNRTSGLLAPDRLRNRHRRSDDPHGGCRVGEALRDGVRCLSAVSSRRACRSFAYDPIITGVPLAIAIIRLAES